MDRGHAEFPVMKGFEISQKDGYDEESSGLSKPGVARKEADVAEAEKLPNHMKEKHPPKKPLETNEDDLTIDPELELVEDASKRDIADGYVQDVQGEKVGKKGFEAYNEMCTKGVAADISFNPHNINESMAAIESHTNIVAKELDDGLVVKGRLGNLANNYSELAKLGGRKIVEGAQAVGSKIAGTAGRAKEGVTEGADYLAGRARKARTVTRAAIRKNPLTAVGAGAAGGAALGAGATHLAENKGISEVVEKGILSRAANSASNVVNAASRAKELNSGIEQKGIREGLKKAGSAIKEGVHRVGAKAERFIEDHPRAAMIGGGIVAGTAVEAGGRAAGGAIGAGRGKRKEGAKAGLGTMVEAYRHPVEATKAQFNDLSNPRFNAYEAGRTLRKKAKRED